MLRKAFMVPPPVAIGWDYSRRENQLSAKRTKRLRKAPRAWASGRPGRRKGGIGVFGPAHVARWKWHQAGTESEKASTVQNWTKRGGGKRYGIASIRHVHAQEIALKNVSPPFDSARFLAKVGGGRSIVKYRKGHKIYTQGEPANAIFYVQKGRVKVTVVSGLGKEAVIAFLGKDEFFGEGCLAGQLLRMATVTAMNDCEIMRIEKRVLIKTLRSEER